MIFIFITLWVSSSGHFAAKRFHLPPLAAHPVSFFLSLFSDFNLNFFPLREMRTVTPLIKSDFRHPGGSRPMVEIWGVAAHKLQVTFFFFEDITQDQIKWKWSWNFFSVFHCKKDRLKILQAWWKWRLQVTQVNCNWFWSIDFERLKVSNLWPLHWRLISNFIFLDLVFPWNPHQCLDLVFDLDRIGLIDRFSFILSEIGFNTNVFGITYFT